jgi:two-component system nitrogen regulation sensor histidine kinase NtrY
MLQLSFDEAAGKPFAEAAPEMAELLDELVAEPSESVAHGQVMLRRGDIGRTLLVRIAREVTNNELLGYVVTFDDVTELVSAQRNAAWADVARRIAHEIKNPLTPIQLSAERLKRKYLKEVQTDPDVFAQCTDTIIRQVGDIGRMVDEFSTFARMPRPVYRDEDLGQLVRQAIFLQQVARQDIRFENELPSEPTQISCDARQIAQVLTNILQNAIDAIDGRERPADGTALVAGRILVRLDGEGDMLDIRVVDNGKGLPLENRDRLFEPYVTTRTKGTGLGLAIVKKIIEEHGGTITLSDASAFDPGLKNGSVARIRLPRKPAGAADHGHHRQDAVLRDGQAAASDRDQEQMIVRKSGLGSHGA